MDQPPAWQSEPALGQRVESDHASSTPALGDDLPPPEYGPSNGVIEPIPSVQAELPPGSFFDIAPSPDATSFQVGYLGLPGFRAWIKGEVLIKLDQAAGEATQRFNRCSITLSAVESGGVESRHNGGLGPQAPRAVTPIDLLRSTQTLWDASDATTSAAGAANAGVPSVMPFSFELTPDLPHCIHLDESGLAYELTAALHKAPASGGGEAAAVVKSIPVHLTRYTPPGDLHDLLSAESAGESVAEASVEAGGPALSMLSVPSDFSLKPHLWSVDAPVTAHVQLPNGTIYRRAQPIDLQIYMPPQRQDSQRAANGPSSASKLKLRAIEAELVRKIWVFDGASDQQSQPIEKESLPEPDTQEEMQRRAAAAKGKLAEDASFDGQTWRAEQDSGLPDYEHGEGPSTITIPEYEQPPPFAPDADSTVREAQRSAPPALRQPAARSARAHESILAYSGKLCRFHSQRPLVLRLTLHPPFDSANMPHPHPDHEAAGLARVHGFGFSVNGSARAGSSSEPDPNAAASSIGLRPAGTGCESVSQETVLHRVEFEVRVRIALHGPQPGQEDAAAANGAGSHSPQGARSSRTERQDVHLQKSVYILPGAAGKVVQFASSAPGPVEAEPTDLQGLESGTSSSSTVTRSNDKQKAAEARADERQGIFANFDAEPEFDGYEDIGRPLTPPPALDSWGAGPSGAAEGQAIGAMPGLANAEVGATAGLTETEQEEHHARNLEQLRQFLEERQLESQPDAPPPTLQESRHDVQLEVPVEGVGMAMPRAAPAFSDVFSFQNGGATASAEDVYDPPPPISPFLPGAPSAHNAFEAGLSQQAQAESRVAADQSAPAAARGQQSASDRERSAEPEADPPSFGDATGHRRSVVAEPPPYRGRASSSNATRSSVSSEAALPPPPPVHDADHRPPAYMQPPPEMPASGLPDYED